MRSQPSSFVHKPTVLSAVQWTGLNELVIQAWLAPILFHELDPEDDTDLGNPLATAELFVNANNLWVPVVTGEWILVDKLGAYPCKDDIFRLNYTRAKAKR